MSAMKIIGIIASIGSAMGLASCSGFNDTIDQVEDILSEVTTTTEVENTFPSQTNNENITSNNDISSPTVVTNQDGLATTTDFSGDNIRFYAEAGPAVVVFPDAPTGSVEYLPLDNLKRPQGAYGYLTYGMYTPGKEREKINFDPVGYAGNNKKVDIVFDANGDGVIEKNKSTNDRAYSGWFYNRSHLIADSIGGNAVRENMVTGTRMQNVGWNKGGEGGMAYTEEKARDYLSSPQSKNCPLYYAATPNYVGSELLPRTVTVNIKSCNDSINEQVVVDNVAPGYTINYMTGSFRNK